MTTELMKQALVELIELCGVNQYGSDTARASFWLKEWKKLEEEGRATASVCSYTRAEKVAKDRPVLGYVETTVHTVQTETINGEKLRGHDGVWAALMERTTVIREPYYGD